MRRFPDAAALAAPWRDTAPRLGWSRPDNYHFTLRFLGDTGPAQLHELESALAGIEFESFEIGLGAEPLLGRAGGTKKSQRSFYLDVFRSLEHLPDATDLKSRW